MTYVNLTPHRVTVIEEDCAGDLCPCDTGVDYRHEEKVTLELAPSGTVARLPESARCPDHPHECPSWHLTPGGCVLDVELGAPVGLPEPVYGTTYVASMPLLMGLVLLGIWRDDVVYPYRQVRDDGGRIIGCRGFARLV